MKVKHIILFMSLTVLLMLLAHWLLSTIDNHKGATAVVLLSLCVITDVFLLVKFFFRFMNS